MIMRKIYLILILSAMCILPAFSQKHGKSDREAMRKEVMDFKLKFLAQEMELKKDQQKKFFELYTQMSEEKHGIFKETRAMEKRLEKNGGTDAEYEAMTRSLTKAKEKDAEIDKKYDDKFSEFLSPKQIFKMKSAEDKFRKKIQQMRHKKNDVNQKSNKGKK